MPQIIEVPELGQVEFPDGMSDADIVLAIRDNLAKPIESPEQMASALRAQGGANYQPMGQMTTTNEGLAEIANDPSQIPAAILGAVSIPGQVAYNVAADVVSKVAGQPEYGGNILYGERQPWQELPVDTFLAEVAQTNPGLATVGRIGQSLSAMSPLAVVGMLPANLGKLAAAGFTVDMIRHAPEQFNAYAEEINKPIEEQNADTLARLRSDIIQTFTFAPLAGAHSVKGLQGEIGYALDLAREGAPRAPRAQVETTGRSVLPMDEGAAVPTWEATEMAKPREILQEGTERTEKTSSGQPDATAKPPQTITGSNVQTGTEMPVQPKAGGAKTVEVGTQESRNPGATGVAQPAAVAQPGAVRPTKETLFHQTPETASFQEFKAGRDGYIYFSTKRDVLSRMKKAGADEDKRPANQVVTAEVSATNPLDVRGLYEYPTSPQKWAGILEGKGIAIPAELQQKMAAKPARDVAFWQFLRFGGVPLREAIQRAKFDAVKFEEWGGETTAIMDGKQANITKRKIKAKPVDMPDAVRIGTTPTQAEVTAARAAEAVKPVPAETQKTTKAKPAQGGDVTIQQQSAAPQAGQLNPPQTAAPVKRVASGLRARKVFDRETELQGPDILSFIQEFGGMMSKTEANRSRGKDWWSQNKSLYDDAAPLQRPQHNVIYGGKSHPDQIAQAAYDAGVLRAPDVNELWIAIRNASNRRAKAFENVRTEEKLLKDQETWMKATAEGELRITPEDLKPGETFEVQGERFVVERFDKNTGEVTIKDGPKFGRQTIAPGQSIWVENASDAIVERIAESPGDFAPPEPAVPKLRPGEKGTGDLLQGEDAPFNLMGERGVDMERVAQEKAARDSAAQANAEFQAKSTKDLFAGSINTGALGELGMGGAKPGEFRNNPQTPTGIRNAIVDQERVRRGLPPAMEAARREFGTVWDEAMARIDQEPEATSRLVQELQAKPRALSDTENALLLHRQIELQNEYGRLTRDLAQAYDDSQSFPNRLADVEELKARVASTSDRLQEVYDVGKAVGTEQGRGLAARKMLAFEDYSLAKMEMEKRAAKGGGPLTDAERAEVVKLQERIARTEAEFQAYREKQEAARAERMTDEAIREMQDELKRRPQYDSRIVKIAEEIVGKLEKQAVSAQERLKAKFARTNTGLDPTIVYDLGVVGAAKIARFGLDFGKFSAEMLAEYGAGVKDYLAASWERANLHLENEGAKYGDKSPAIKNILRKRDATSKRENVIAGLKKGKAEGIPVQMEGDYIRKLAEGFVEAGIRTREALVDAVHEVLTKEVGLELTRRETMDAISGYGKYKALNPNAIKATLRDLRGQMQQVAKLEDIEARKPLQKTGLERRTPSDEERRLLQQVNEAKRRFGVVVNDPARQLKSALDAIKTRLKHQISDIEYQINTRERIVKTKTPAPFDAETKLLEMRRDALRAQLDELVPKPGLTVAQQIQRVANSLERSIADYEARIKGGDVAARERKTPLSTPELEALRARRDAARAEWEELRASSEAYQWEQQRLTLARQKTALEQSIAAKEKQIAAGDFATEPRAVNRPADPALEALIQKREALNRQIAEARRKPDAQKYAEAQERLLQQIQRQIAERQAKLAAGDLSRNSQPRAMNRPMSPELEQAKQQLELVNRQLEEARKGPKLTPEERALKILKARLAQSTANYVDRLARHDFKKRERYEPRLDAEALRLKAENEIAKREFQRGLIMDRLAQRTLGQKVYAGVKESLNLPRNLLSSWDVSAVLRQGGFIALGNPLRAAAGLGPMFKALASEKAAIAVEQEILSRPNAPLYKQSKLYLAPHEALHLSAMEEAIMSRMAGKVPGLRASNRAYITFLNRLRADSFDALVNSIARKDGNLTPPELQAVANYINVATGRGDLGKASAAAETLATVFFSPRLLASRFQLLAGQPLYRGSARTRLAVAQEYGKFLAGIGVVYALGALAGATIEPDPRSSDFGKLKFGNTRVDVLGGLSQATTLLGRLTSGQTITASGQVRDIRGDVPYGARTSADVIANFLRSKLSPVVGTGVDIAQGRNVVGEPVTPKTVAVNMTVPLSFRDIYDVMAEQGMARGTILGVLSLFGFGLQQYETKAASPEVMEIMKRVRGVTPEQRDEIRKRVEESLK